MAEPRTTKLGTPCSAKWPAHWIEIVDRVEAQEGHRICGAHSTAGTPCRLEPATITHPHGFTVIGHDTPKTPPPDNGRCRFHGGAAGIGAPLGNRNAIIHGLYSRRLQRCGKHCPVWQWCPAAGKDVLALAPNERPLCVYEKEEYNALTLSSEKEKGSKEKSMPGNDEGGTRSRASARDANESTSALASSGSIFSSPKENVEESPLVAVLHHNIATFQVMLTRAQTALGIVRLTQETHANSENYSMTSPKVSALLQAEMRIARELRQWLRLLAYEPLRKVLHMNEDEPGEPISLPAMMVPILAKAEGVLESALRPTPLGPKPGTALP